MYFGNILVAGLIGKQEFRIRSYKISYCRGIRMVLPDQDKQCVDGWIRMLLFHVYILSCFSNQLEAKCNSITL